MTDKDNNSPDDSPPNDSFRDDSNMTPAERLATMLALLADSESPIGSSPDLKEIQDWQLGNLDEKRAAEVKTHVARDPACYKMWSDLQAASTLEPTVEKSSQLGTLLGLLKRFWFNPLWVGSGGMVTALLVIVVVMYFPSDKSVWSPTDDPIYAAPEFDWPYIAMSSTRNGNIHHRFKHAFQTGLRSGLQLTTQGQQGWSAAIDNLPEKLLSCDNSSNTLQCQQQSQIVQSVGVHAAVLYIACVEREVGKQTHFDKLFWESQNEAWNKLSTELKNVKLNVFAKATDKIKSTKESQQCDSVRDLIYMNY